MPRSSRRLAQPLWTADTRPEEPETSRLADSPIFGIVAAIPSLAGCVLAGTGINIMIHVSVGPAILLQLMYAMGALVAVVMSISGLVMAGDRIAGTTAWLDQRAGGYFWAVVLACGPLILIAAIIFPSRTVPVLAPIAHWIVTVLGPLGH